MRVLTGCLIVATVALACGKKDKRKDDEPNHGTGDAAVAVEFDKEFNFSGTTAAGEQGFLLVASAQLRDRLGRAVCLDRE